MKKEIELYEKEKDDITVSLSLTERERRVAERKARKEARKEKRAAMLAAVENHNPLLGQVTLLFDSNEELKSADTLAAEQAAAEEAAAEEAEAEEEEPFVDFRLHETARILADFIDIKKQHLIAATDKDKESSNQP